jgi:hypothetical protein
MSSDPFPEKEALWLGSVFGGIVTAVMSAKSDLYANFARWSENEYVLDGMDGREGVIVFEFGWRSGKGSLVGLFFDPNSELSPYRAASYEVARFLHGMSPGQRELVTPAYQGYMFNKHEGDGVPEITAAFWSLDNHLTANFPWEEVMRNGASLIENELKGYSDEAVAVWQSAYEMSSTQVALTVNLFQQRIGDPSVDIRLTNADVQQLKREAADERSFRACREALDAMGILFPANS